MKKITIIAISEFTVKAMYNFFMEVFSDIVEICCFTVSEYEKIENDNSNLLVLSGKECYQLIKNKIHDKKIIISHRYIDYSNLDILSNIEAGSTLFLVNDQYSSSVESISQLNQIGYDFNLIPCYPGASVNKNITEAITIGEPQLVPKSVDVIYNIGSRVSSISTLTDIAFSLNMEYSVIDTITWSYLSKYALLLKKNRSHIEELHRSDQIIKNVFDYSESGITVISDTFTIKTMNKKCLSMMNLSIKDIMGRNFFDVLSTRSIEISLEEILGYGKVVTGYNNSEILITGYEIPSIAGNSILVYASYTADLREKEIAIRIKENLYNKGIRYDFSDYITVNSHVKKMLKNIKKIAQYDSCVLIQGESGTGKEIIAQSIHKNSPRKNQPFIPVNFAAIQPSLLESELFGYAEGSFTGAKKGGSKGLFEKAHKGTIFIDEIGDAPVEFQVRLLRVLQEKEIRRVGDSKRIPLDVRVIVATNKDLISLVDKGNFREDLYFRINVLPVDTIPLRDRRNDIKPLMDHYIRIYFNNADLEMNDICTNRLISYLNAYSWRGNVREIANSAEYFSCVKGVKKLDIKDLPQYMQVRKNNTLSEIEKTEKEILDIISNNPGIGRYSICRKMNASGNNITEGKIRSLLSKLKDNELIHIKSTRGGCEITGKALKILEGFCN